MPITLPDSTYFDNDNDSIKDSRPELKKISDAVNTLATEWNNNGDSFGTGVGGSETLDATSHDTFTTDLDQTKTIHILNAGTLVSDSAGDYHEIKMNVDNLLSSPAGTIHYFILSCTGTSNIIPVIIPYINSKRTINEVAVYNAWEFLENVDTGVVRVTVLSSTKILVENQTISGTWSLSIERES